MLTVRELIIDILQSYGLSESIYPLDGIAEALEDGITSLLGTQKVAESEELEI